MASVLSTNAFLGETGFSYATQGGAFILWPSIWVTGYVWGALYFGRYLRRSRALTVAEFFGWRFDSRPVQAAAGVTIVLGLGGTLRAVGHHGLQDDRPLLLEQAIALKLPLRYPD